MSKIKLFWYSTTRLENKEKENFGDLLSNYLVEKISKSEVEWVFPKNIKWFSIVKKHYLAIGSILSHATKRSIVWGSGIIEKKEKVEKAIFLAVRGPQTRFHLLNKGYEVPEIYGDPAILTPNYYNPQIEKTHEIGIICHFVDFDDIQKKVLDSQVKIINLLTNSIESKLDEILSCKSIVSSSLHGVIVGQTYGIPSLWIKFSDKLYGDDIKFQDYYESVNLPFRVTSILENKITYDLLKSLLEQNKDILLPKESHLQKMRSELMNACPFK
jgi:hypothetical protein